jgi:Ca-activated chloride channel family protein
MNQQPSLRCFPSLVALAMGFLVSFSTVATANPDAGAIVPTVESWDESGSKVVPAPVPLVAATYDVHVYGGTAVGALIQEFRNDGEERVRGRLRTVLPAHVEVVSLRLRPDATELEIVDQPDSDEKSEDQAAAEVARLAGQLRAGSPRLSESQSLEMARRILEGKEDARAADGRREPLVSEWFDLPAEETTVLETGFRIPLDVEGHRMRLVLPALALPSPAPADPEIAPLPLSISVTVHHEEPLIDLTSGSHSIVEDFVGDRTVVEPVAATVPFDRPFVLEYALQADDRPNLVSRVRGTEGGLQEVETLVNPPTIVPATEVRPKQVLFVVDTSGSMARSEKLEQAKRAVDACVDALRTEDRFNVVEFDSKFSWFLEQPADSVTVRDEAFDTWLGGLEAEGGTVLLPALRSAMDQPGDSDRLRILILVTDGILADEEAALGLLDDALGEARLFVVGTGPQLRQETLLRLAEHGRGAATFASGPDQLEAAVSELFASVADPLGWDVEFDWGGAEVEEVTPSRLPDLYAGRAVRVLAQVRGDLPETLRIRMTTTEGEEWLSVRLPPLDP